MVNRISFTGRETMLTAGLKTGLKKVENKFPEVIEASSILPTKPESIKAAVYTSPFAPQHDNVVKIVSNEPVSPISGLNIFG